MQQFRNVQDQMVEATVQAAVQRMAPPQCGASEHRVERVVSSTVLGTPAIRRSCSLGPGFAPGVNAQAFAMTPRTNVVRCMSRQSSVPRSCASRSPSPMAWPVQGLASLPGPAPAAMLAMGGLASKEMSTGSAPATAAAPVIHGLTAMLAPGTPRFTQPSQSYCVKPSPMAPLAGSPEDASAPELDITVQEYEQPAAPGNGAGDTLPAHERAPVRQGRGGMAMQRSGIDAAPATATARQYAEAAPATAVARPRPATPTATPTQNYRVVAQVPQPPALRLHREGTWSATQVPSSMAVAGQRGRMLVTGPFATPRQIYRA